MAPGSLALGSRSAEHTSELQSPDHLVCRPLLVDKTEVTGVRLVICTSLTVVVALVPVVSSASVSCCTVPVSFPTRRSSDLCVGASTRKLLPPVLTTVPAEVVLSPQLMVAV